MAKTPKKKEEKEQKATAEYNPLGTINAYTCDSCRKRVITVNSEPGLLVTPAFLACRMTEGCKGFMSSHWNRVPQNLEPTHEWFRPKPAELIEAPQEVKDYVLRGGALLRPLDTPEVDLPILKVRTTSAEDQPEITDKHSEIYFDLPEQLPDGQIEVELHYAGRTRRYSYDEFILRLGFVPVPADHTRERFVEERVGRQDS